MISMKMNSYNEKQANLLLELFNTAFETILDEHCYITNRVDVGEENACQFCIVSYLSIDILLQSVVDKIIFSAINFPAV